MTKPSLTGWLGGDLRPLLGRFAAFFECSPLRLPGSFEADVMSGMARMILDGLAQSLPLEQLVPGAIETREIEKTVGFVASSWAADNRSGFDLIALLRATEECLLEVADEGERNLVHKLFDWLLALSADSFAGAGVRAERERQREQLERGMPVTVVAPGVPAAFLVGVPDTFVLDGVFGRLLMLIVRTGARTAIIDATGLRDPSAPANVVSLDRFAQHRKLGGNCAILAVGLDVEGEHSWSGVVARAEVDMHILPSFEAALNRALESTDYRLVRRPSA